MQQNNPTTGLCFICLKAPIKRICLNEECIKNNTFLLCDQCRKIQPMRKYASQIHEIDAYSNIFSLFSINSINKEQSIKVQESLRRVRQLARDNFVKIYDNFADIETKIIQNVVELSETFDSQKSEHMQIFFKNPNPQEHEQLLKKVNTLKWLKQNQDLVSNSETLSNKISNFSEKFDSGFKLLSTKIQTLIKQFCLEFNINQFFVDGKKSQKTIARQRSRTAPRKIPERPKSNQKDQKSQKLKQNSKADEKPQMTDESIRQNLESSQLNMEIEQQFGSEKPSENIKSEQIMISGEKNPSKSSLPCKLSGKQVLKTQKQKIPMISEPIQQTKIIKKTQPKPAASRSKHIPEQQPKPRLILQRIPVKSDYPQEEILTINLRTVAQIFWNLNHRKSSTQNRTIKEQAKVKFQPMQNNFDGWQRNSPDSQINSNKVSQLNLEKIKYLEVQELPKNQSEIFTVKVDGQQTDIFYSVADLQDKIQSMTNLQQIHIFKSSVFLNESQFLQILFTSPNLKVVSFSCWNPVSRVFQRYRDLIGNTLNQEMKILQIAGNIPFCQNMEIADLKAYYPESQRNKKIYDQYFAQNKDEWIQQQLQDRKATINQKQKFEHPTSCWFYRKQIGLLQRQRFQLNLTPEDNSLISKCFSELRNCWIPQLRDENFDEIQANTNLQKIEHLSLGFHYVKLQPIPDHFFFGPKCFSKSLTNLKSLNFVNLNINALFLKTFFTRKCKELISLKVEFCSGLSNDFYSNLPTYCPQLRKLSVNNLSAEINGDFISKFKQLETIILPWSQINYNGLQGLMELEKNDENFEKKANIIEQEVNGLDERIHFKKWKYINIYGCTWFHTDFLSVIDLKSINHLNIGKCRNIDIQDLIEYLKICENLESLCIDELPLTNDQLFTLLRYLPKLTKLSLAQCPNLNFQAGHLSRDDVQMLDRMTHLDLRNQIRPIACDYTLQMKNPKYLLISRGFDVEENELAVLTQRHIYASSVNY